MKKQAKLFIFCLGLAFIFALYLVVHDPEVNGGLFHPQTAAPSAMPSAMPSATPAPSPLPVLGVSDQKNREKAKVIRVVDGDTVELEDGRKLRYIGMNTPEIHHPRKPVECFGQEAARRNKELVEGQEVELEKDVSETDRYGRLLRYVWLNGVLINQQLVEEGYAMASSYPPDIARQAQFRLAEAQARLGRRGLWQACPQ